MRHIVCAGYTSRDRADAERHIQELENLGIARPKEVPIFFAVASYLATVEQMVEVQGPFTSGEAEVALVLGPGGPWVTVASDQTDRFVERHSVPASKQLCPKVLAPTVWPLAEVEGALGRPRAPGVGPERPQAAPLPGGQAGEPPRAGHPPRRPPPPRGPRRSTG